MTMTDVARRWDAGRRGFRTWRHRRPFWGGLLTILSGLQIFASTQLTIGNLQVRVGVEGLQSIVIPVVLVLAGLLIWFMPVHRVFYGVIALVVAVYSLIGVNLGGFVIGLLLGVVGGSLAIAWAPREGDIAATKGAGAGEVTDDGEVSDDSEGTVSVDELLHGDRPADEHAHDAETDEHVRPGVADELSAAGEPSAADEPSAGDQPRDEPPRHRYAGRRSRGRGSAMRYGVAAGAGSVVFALAATAVPSVAGPSNSLLPPLPWPFESPEPSSSPEPTSSPEEPDTPGPTPEPTGLPLPTGLPVPTGLPIPPTSEPTTEPTSDPSSDPTPTPEPDPSGTASPQPTDPSPSPSPTESPVIEVPEGETPAEPRALETPDKPAGEHPSHLTGSRLTMSGLSYDGVVEVPTDSGSIRSLQFSMDESVVDDFSLLVPSSDGHDLLTLSDQLTVAGDVKFYTDRFSGTLLGIPLTFTPDFPPPLVLPNMVFGDPDINLVYIDSDSLTAESMRQFFPDD